ncbi:hypothetical protein [Holospora undulata]|uniref:Uncharacterized protein n=1 Tax=Holospora undulata HU1 TaxID=1321371 RepID=A0A061JGQ3_9PROT|nr:hypothetical protein [Holospora undulata]ETZ05245.1 putative protein y4nM [Holospora undulata HU1]
MRFDFLKERMLQELRALYRPSPEELFKILDLGRVSLPICIDLDFTLLQSSSLYFFFPQAFFGLPKLLYTQSWAAFKWWVSMKYPINPETLPYRSFLIDFLKLCKTQNIPLVLATGASYPTAYAVGAYLNCFDHIISSTQTIHCVGSAKAKALIDLYGENKFYYFGDSKKDLLVWKHAYSVVALDPSDAFSKRIKNFCAEKRCFFLYDRVK